MGYLQCKHRSFDCGLCAKETLKVPEGWQLVPVEPIKTGNANISREHLVAIAEKCGLLGAYRTREFVDVVVGYGQVLLRDKAVQEAMYRAALAAAPKKEQSK